MELVLHIGMPKTGTTAIQMSFHRARPLLRRQGVFYPDIGVLHHAHHALMPLFLDRADWWGLVVKGLAGRDPHRWAEAAWDDLVARARASGARQVVLSTEALFVELDPARRDAFAARLRAAFPTVRVAAYVRAPEVYYRSILLERAKRTLVAPDPSGIRYRTPIAQFEEALDIRADIRPYTREALTDGDAVADFCAHHLGIGTAPDPVHSNRSLRPETLEAYQAIMSGVSGARNWPTNWAMIKRLKAIEGAIEGAGGAPRTDAAIRPELSAWIAGAYAPETDWLERERGVAMRSRPAPEGPAARPRVRRLRDAFEMDADFQAAVLRAVDDETGLPPGTHRRLREIEDDVDGLMRGLSKRPQAPQDRPQQGRTRP